VMRKATHRGGEAFAQSDFKQALGYYQDAQTACPGNAEAELNLARAYEALGEREAAVSNYTRAANAASGSDPAIVKQARDALERLRAAK
jgi:tetratricopeptide (TPR) repeat protein